MANIGENVLCRIALGEMYDGTEPSFSGEVNFKGRARSVDLDIDLKETDTRALGDFEERNRFYGKSRKLDLSSVIVSNYTFYGTESDFLGYWIRVILWPDNAANASRTFEGVITKWKHSVDQGKEQMENITVNLSVDRPSTQIPLS